MIERLLNTREIAKLLGVCDKTVINYIHRGVLPAIKFDKEYRIRESSLEKFIDKKEAMK